jgi:hypothetical protein
MNDFAVAMSLGFASSVHCVGMCGGIVSALSLGAAPAVRQSRARLIGLQTAYNAGRITSYCIAGLLAAAAGAGLAAYTAPRIGHRLLDSVAVFILILAGLHISGWGSGLLKLEAAGARLWRWAAPLGQRLLPVDRMTRAFAFGLIWGWLPCGLVYSALAWSALQTDALAGAWTMFGFGLGTLPAMLGAGLVTGKALDYLRWPPLRRCIGALLLIYGLYRLTMI